MSMNITDDHLAMGTTLFQWLDYIMFAFIMSLSILIGIWFGVCGGAKNITTVDYLLGGKTMATIPVTLSLIASQVSGITLMGIPSEVYMYGTMYCMMNTSYLFTGLIMNYIFLPVFYGLQLTSTFEYLELRFNRGTRGMASFLFTLSLLLFAPIVVYVASLALSQVSGFSLHLISPLVCIVCIFYTMIGGIKAVVWTDFLQYIVMMCSCITVVIIGIIKINGLSTIWERSDAGGRLQFFDMDPSPFRRNTFWTVTIGATFDKLYNSGIVQTNIQRYLSLPNINSAKRALKLFLLGTVLMNLLSCFTGLLIYATYYDCDPLKKKDIKRIDQLLPYYVMNIAGNIPGLPGLFVAGIFSAALSSLSTALNSLSGTIYEDFVRPCMKTTLSDKKINMVMKTTVVVFGVICVALVFVIDRMGGILEVSASLAGITTGGLLGLFTLGVIFPWVNAKGALIGSISSLLLMSWIVLGGRHALRTGTVVHPWLNTTTAGCGFNFTHDVMSEPTKGGAGDAFMLYRLSYMYYTMVGAFMTVIVALPASFATGPRNPHDMDPALFAPVIRKYLGPRATPGPPDEIEVIYTKSS